MGVINKLFGRLRVVSDSNVTTQTSSVIQADSGNTNLVIAPSGTGGLVAQIPDGTTTGGAARGNNAVDLQMSRSAANQVASSSNSFIGGGANNRIVAGGTQSSSFIGGGIGNIINSSSTAGMVIVGGTNNTINQNDQGQYPMFIGGGQSNTIGGAGGVIVGGSSNVGGGYNINWTTIGGGNSNTASAQLSTVIGGQSNVSSGTGSSVIGGRENVSSGDFSTSQGRWARAFGAYSVGLGYGGTTRYQGQLAVSANGPFSGLLGDNGSSYQFSDLLCFNLLDNFNSGDSLNLYPGANSANILTSVAIANMVWHVTAKCTMYVANVIGTATGINVGDTLFATYSFGYRNGTGAFVTATFTSNKVSNNVNLETGLFSFALGSSNQLLVTMTAPTFAGGGQLRIRGNVKLELVETIQGIGI